MHAKGLVRQVEDRRLALRGAIKKDRTRVTKIRHQGLRPWLVQVGPSAHNGRPGPRCGSGRDRAPRWGFSNEWGRSDTRGFAPGSYRLGLRPTMAGPGRAVGPVGGCVVSVDGMCRSIGRGIGRSNGWIGRVAGSVVSVDRSCPHVDCRACRLSGMSVAPAIWRVRVWTEGPSCSSQGQGRGEAPGVAPGYRPTILPSPEGAPYPPSQP
jgi:hypothetical protein